MACSQNTNLRLSKSRRILIFGLGLMDSMLFGGAVFGWPQLVYILKSQHVYSDLCDANYFSNITIDTSNEEMSFSHQFEERCDYYQNLSSRIEDEVPVPPDTNGCLAQDDRFALIFTIGVLCYGVPGIVIGFMLHYAGLRATRMLGGFFVSASFFCLSITNKENPIWLFPSTVLLAIGGNTLRMSGMQLGDLFPRYRSTAITVMSGIYAASASLFLVFSMLAEAGIDTMYVCYFFAGFSGFSALLSFIMPLHHIPYENDQEKSMTSARFSLPLKRSLVTWSSCLHLYYFFMGLFVINVYQQNYNVWVTDASCSVEETRVYTNWFSYSNMISAFMAPVGGAFTDYMVKRAKEGSLNRIEFAIKEIQANFVPLLTTTILTLVMYSCYFFTHPVAIIVSLICMIVVRPCIIAISTAYVRIRFPGEHFNRLLGIYSTTSSILLFLQYPHFQLARQMYYTTHGITLLFVSLCLLNPLHLLNTKYLRKAVMERDNLEETAALREKQDDEEHLQAAP